MEMTSQDIIDASVSSRTLKQVKVPPNQYKTHLPHLTHIFSIKTAGSNGNFTAALFKRIFSPLMINLYWNIFIPAAVT